MHVNHHFLFRTMLDARWETPCRALALSVAICHSPFSDTSSTAVLRRAWSAPPYRDGMDIAFVVGSGDSCNQRQVHEATGTPDDASVRHARLSSVRRITETPILTPWRKTTEHTEPRPDLQAISSTGTSAEVCGGEMTLTNG
ncbi:hypothetical protein FKP32DRAFT_1438890 [Trametes sanguinea]|nr:hypothetical protein FKP32DRAFT_1438890 [Trametes sanguinea]